MLRLLFYMFAFIINILLLMYTCVLEGHEHFIVYNGDLHPIYIFLFNYDLFIFDVIFTNYLYC